MSRYQVVPLKKWEDRSVIVYGITDSAPANDVERELQLPFYRMVVTCEDQQSADLICKALNFLYIHEPNSDLRDPNEGKV